MEASVDIVAVSPLRRAFKPPLRVSCIQNCIRAASRRSLKGRSAHNAPYAVYGVMNPLSRRASLTDSFPYGIHGELSMSPVESGSQKDGASIKRLAGFTRQVLKEPILKALLDQSVLTPVQLETLLIDLVVEGEYGDHIPYEDKATFRSRSGSRKSGVTRGSFNRTLRQARRNVTRCFYTMLLLAYLGLFNLTLFRPFEEVASRIGDYRRVREVLSGKTKLSKEEMESYRLVEETILSALEELTSSTALKSELSRRKSVAD